MKNQIMNTLEQNEIKQYLNDKRLPLDLYREIEEHISMQIEELMRDENIGFYEAFNQVKVKWTKDLSFAKINFNDPKQVPKIVQKIRGAYAKAVLPKILMISCVFVVVLIIGAFYLPKESFKNLYWAIDAAFALPVLLVTFGNFKYLMLKSKYRKQPINAYQQLADASFAGAMFPLMMLMNTSLYSHNFYDAVQHFPTAWGKLLLQSFVVIYFSSICLFAMFSFLKFKNEAKKLQLA